MIIGQRIKMIVRQRGMSVVDFADAGQDIHFVQKFNGSIYRFDPKEIKLLPYISLVVLIKYTLK